MKNFIFAQYAFVPTAILSLTSSSIEWVSFIMDPKYLYYLTCSIYELLIFNFSILMSFFWGTVDILFKFTLLPLLFLVFHKVLEPNGHFRLTFWFWCSWQFDRFRCNHKHKDSAGDKNCSVMYLLPQACVKERRKFVILSH